VITDIFTALIICVSLVLLTAMIVLTVKDYREFNRQQRSRRGNEMVERDQRWQQCRGDYTRTVKVHVFGIDPAQAEAETRADYPLWNPDGTDDSDRS
jgi:hypothetical protein